MSLRDRRLPRLSGPAVLLSCATLGFAVVSATQGVPEQSLGTLLETKFGFSAAQVATIRRGQPVARVLPSSVDREVAIGGAVHVKASAERLVDLLQDVERLESGKSFLATRRLSTPPRLEDFDGLTLPKGDVDALKRCRPGSCDVKLGQGAFDQLKQIDWNQPDAAAAVNRLARRAALEYIQAYRKGGNQELAIYLDTDRPQFIAREFADMLTRTRLLPESIPALSDYLLNFPLASLPPGSSDLFYWSLADFGLKPVVRLNHLVVYSTGEPAGMRYAVAVKQLYASHYFHTALEIRAVIDDAASPGTASYVVVLNMARSDGLTGLFGGVVKSKVRGRSRESLEKALAAIKRLAEAPR